MTAPPWLRALTLAALLPLAACADDNTDDGGSTGPTPTLMVKAVLDASGGVVRVTDASVPITGATVQLNGVVGSSGASDGEYEVRLPSPVAVGGAMRLEVRHGDQLVLGNGTVPESPVMTDASSSDSFDPAFPFEVAWSSATNPERFEVVAVGPSSRSFPVEASAARAYTVPSGTLPKGEWNIRARAINLGTLGGDEEANSSMVISADAASPISIQLVPRLFILANMDDSSSSISLILEGRMVDGAVVSVNGETAVQDAPGELYLGHLADHASVGDPLTLSVIVGADSYVATGNLPEAPVITVAQRGLPLRVEWTSSTDPDRFEVRITGSSLGGPYSAAFQVAGTGRSFAIPGVPTIGTYTVSVDAIEDGVFTGNVQRDSRMGVHARAFRSPGF